MPSTPAQRTSIRLVKSFPYKGGTKLWGNRYFFTGDDMTDAQFLAIATILKNEEVQCQSSRCTITDAVGYHAGSEVPVWSHTFSATGSFTPVSTNYTNPGDAAALMRFSTTQRSVKNHPIYLFKYFHNAYSHSAGSPDELDHGQKEALESFGTDLLNGLSDGTNTRQLCGPRGAVAQSRLVDTYITHRDFPS